MLVQIAHLYALGCLGIKGLSAVLNSITPSARERAAWAPIMVIMCGLAGFVMVVSRGAP